MSAATRNYSRGARHSEAVRSGQERERQRRSVSAKTVQLYRRGVITPAAKPFVELLEEEAVAVALALGGAELAPMKLSVIHENAETGCLRAMLMARVLAGDLDPLAAAPVIASLSRSRLAAFTALGLDWRKSEADVDDLAEAHRQRERDERAKAAQDAKSAVDDAEVVADADRGADREQRTEGHA